MTRLSSAAASLIAAAMAFSPVALADDDDKDRDGSSRSFHARLTGGQEVPPIETRTRGSARFLVDRRRTSIAFRVKVRVRDDDVGLLGVAGAHIHCAPPGENGPVAAFLAGDMPGGLVGRVEFAGTLTQANIINDVCGATIAELAAAMRDGDTYVNVHSLANPSGEVRGNIRASRD